MKQILTIFATAFITLSYGPPNCNLYEGDCAKGCHEAELAIRHGQGARAGQIHFDKSIALCPTFDYSYYEKSVPYAKRGYMHHWIFMLNKALDINRKEYLGTRAWYHYFFMHNYQKAIDDLDELNTLTTGDISMTGDGEYHLNVMKALCYRGLGQNQTALELIEVQLAEPNHDPGLYDYYYHGVLYYDLGQYQKAIEAFQNQIERNDLADVHYYIALCQQKLGNSTVYSEHLQTALSYYDQEKHLNNSYTDHMDKVYRQMIVDEINSTK